MAPIVCFGKQAEIAGQYLTKGKQVCVEGRIQTRSWEDRNSGEKKYRTEIVCDNFQMLGQRGGDFEGSDRQAAQAGPTYDRGATAAAAAAAGTSRTTTFRSERSPGRSERHKRRPPMAGHVHRSLFLWALWALAFSQPLLAATPWTWAGPDGGAVLSLALQPNSSTVLYAGGEAGLFKSVDGGANWQLLAEGPAAPVIAIGVDPIDTSTVYAGLRRQGLLKSTDGGAHWTDAGQGLPDLPPFGLSVNALAVRGGAVYAGTDLGLYRSVDGGASWQALSEGLPASPVLSLEIDPSQSETIYAGLDNGLFRSTDGGAHWAPSPANGFALGDVSDVEVSPVSSAIVYAGSPYGVSRSVDAGVSWLLSQATGSVNALAVHPTLAGTLYAGSNNGVFKSTDGGTTWVKMSEGLTDPRVLALAIDLGRPREAVGRDEPRFPSGRRIPDHRRRRALDLAQPRPLRRRRRLSRVRCADPGHPLRRPRLPGPRPQPGPGAYLDGVAGPPGIHPGGESRSRDAVGRVCRDHRFRTAAQEHRRRRHLVQLRNPSRLSPCAL